MRIRQKRKELKIKQYMAAEYLGIKESTYSQMERTGHITCETAMKLAKLFDTDLNTLLFGIEKSEIPIMIEKKEEKENSFKEDKLELTPNEVSIITILRNFTKSDREECIAFIEKKYHLSMM